MYTKLADKIIVDSSDFDIRHILDCGQIFRYNIDGDTATIISTDKKIIVNKVLDTYEIFCDDLDYACNFFDLYTDYGAIKEELKKDPLVSDTIEFGKGIRILNQDLFEMIVEFIISANNNIPRIKNSIEKICAKFGAKHGDYFAFPTLKSLKRATVQDFTDCGLGYRAGQLADTISRLTDEDISNFKTLCYEGKIKFLMSLKGIGSKVCNCIMLFGAHDMNSFPVDTWIKKVYSDKFNDFDDNAKSIEEKLKARYKGLSGYAQQYFFYYYRENFKKRP